METATCRGQTWGHNFPYTGANCMSCGVNQDELSGKRQRVDKTIQNVLRRIEKPKKVAGIHSQMHWLVDEMRKTFGETAKKGKGSFGFYLGMLNRIGFQEAYRLYKEVTDEPCQTPVKLFWWKYSQLKGRGGDNTTPQKCNDNV